MIACVTACLIAASEPTWPPPPDPRSVLITIVEEPKAVPLASDICAEGTTLRLRHKGGNTWRTCQ